MAGNGLSMMLIVGMVLAIVHSTAADIRVVSTEPSTNGTIVRKGEDAILSCRTDRKWFFCLWTSPGGDRQCAIQEHEPSQVCKGDPRLLLSGSENSCDLRILDVDANDWGPWMCLVNDDINFSTAREHILLEVGSEGRMELSSPSLVSGDLLRLTEGEETRIHCTVTGAHPPPTFSWSGPDPATQADPAGYPDRPDGELARVRKYVREEAPDIRRMFYGNISVIEQGFTEPAADGRSVDSVTSILYSASLNDTNSTISCEMRQVDGFGRVLYSTTKYLRIHVDALPPPLPVVSYGEKVGIVSGIILACLFLLLVCVLLTVFMCRRERRRKQAGDNQPRNSDYQIKPIWTTSSSKGGSRRRGEELAADNNGGFQSIGSRYPDNHSYRSQETLVYHHPPTAGSGGLCPPYDSDSPPNSGGSSSDQSGKLSDRSCRSVNTFSDPDGGDGGSKRSSASYETERSLAEIESGSVMFHPAAPSLLGSSTLLHGSVNLRPAQSLHETHFGVGGTDSPLTILHPPGVLMTLPRPSTLDDYLGDRFSEYASRKVSTARSEGAGPTQSRCLPPGSRPASTLGVNLAPDWRQPQRISTPTCPGSLLEHRSTSSVFRCPHDCFMLDESEEHRAEQEHRTAEANDAPEAVERELEEVAKSINRTFGKMSML